VRRRRIRRCGPSVPLAARALRATLRHANRGCGERRSKAIGGAAHGPLEVSERTIDDRVVPVPQVGDVEDLAAIRIIGVAFVEIGDRDELARNAPELVELIPSSRLVTIAGRDHMGAVPAREFKQAVIEFLSEE
jgi:hypothetical protein